MVNLLSTFELGEKRELSSLGKMGGKWAIVESCVCLWAMPRITKAKGNRYRMWNSTTKQVSETRDVIFINRMFYQTPVTVMNKPILGDEAEDDTISVREESKDIVRQLMSWILVQMTMMHQAQPLKALLHWTPNSRSEHWKVQIWDDIQVRNAL